jgi:CBS domain-containing protein
MLGKICTKPVVTASAQMTVEQAARAMRSKNVGALVVVNAGRPVGMLTDRDVAVEVVANGSLLPLRHARHAIIIREERHLMPPGLARTARRLWVVTNMSWWASSRWTT